VFLILKADTNNILNMHTNNCENVRTTDEIW